METLGYGVKKPANGDKGNVFFPALASNAQKQNDHTHNGTDGAPISTKHIEAGTLFISSGWIADGNYFSQSVAMPSGYTFGNQSVVCIGAPGTAYAGEQLHLRVERISDSHFFLFSPVNDLEVNVRFV